MPGKSKADLVVGIDFGMTYTGVAYSTFKMPTPRVIQNWPGKTGETHNKIPTILLYSPGTRKVKDWGFTCQHSEAKKEWFKRFLDPEKLRVFRARDSSLPDLAEVRKWYKDYMKCLYDHLSATIQAKTGKWEGKQVEFVFSLPSTFTTPVISQNLRSLTIQAGFGKGGKGHSVSFGLTEPEASAVYTAKETAVDFQVGDIMLVCDAGGGTTDFAILESVGDEDGLPELQELVVVEGQDIGSTNIDLAFERMAEERLNQLTPKFDDGIAWTMMHESDFIGWKCTFGQEDNKILKTFPIKIPTASSDLDCRTAGIKGGKMLLSQKDLRDLFDPEIEKMIQLIWQQLASFRARDSKKKIDYIILSGGLGSSPYVRSKLEAIFLGNRERVLSSELQILVSEEPQLAVVKGLVIDRIQKMKSGKSVLKGRVCRASYGIDVSTLYDQHKHVGQPIYRDYDGELRVTDQTCWLIKKGEVIDPEKPLIHVFTMLFLPSSARKWSTGIFISQNDANKLPTHTAHADVSLVCNIVSDLESVSLDKFNKKKAPRKISGFKSQPYYEACYKIKVIIGAADIKFELWFQGVQYMDQKYIDVEWEKA